MVKKKYIVLILMLSLLNINKTHAVCSKEEIDTFKKIENKFKVTYEFNKGSKDYTLKFKTPNQSSFDYIIYTDVKLDCEKINEEETECYNFPPNTYDLAIIGLTDTCDDELKTLTLKLDRYNSFSEDPLCEGIEEFVLCQPTYNKEVDYETFVSRVNTYKKTKLKEEQERLENETQQENEIITYIKDNFIQIIIITIFVILVIITTIVSFKSIRKSRRLE